MNIWIDSALKPFTLSIANLKKTQLNKINSFIFYKWNFLHLKLKSSFNQVFMKVLNDLQGEQ